MSAAEIALREAQLFGGLVVPRVTPGFKVSGSDLVEFLKGRIAERSTERRAVYTVYVPDPVGQYNAVVGRPYDSVDQIPVGDVFFKVPGGVYAVFRPNGEYADPIEDVWAQVWAASDSGAIVRAYSEEVEVCSSVDQIELYISVEL